MRAKSLVLTSVIWLWSSAAFAQIWIGVNSPTSGAIVGDSALVNVTTMGAVSRAEARIGMHVVALGSAGTGTQTRTGALDLTGEPAGPKTLTATAYDSTGAPTSATVNVVLDRPPVIQVLEPAPGTVVRTGTVRVRATCTDDGPTPCTLEGSAGQVPALDELRTVTGQEGKEYKIRITAKDSASNTAATEMLLYVESSDHLREVLTAPEGEVIDFDGARALVVSPDKLHAKIFSAAASPVGLYGGPDSILRGQLFEGGALVVTRVGTGVDPTLKSAWLYRGSQGTRIGVDAQIAGNYLGLVAVGPPYVPGDPASAPLYVVVRNLATDQDVWIEPHNASPRAPLTDVVVAPNGDAAWQFGSSSGGLRRWHNGVVTDISAGRYLGSLAIDESHFTASYGSSFRSEIYLYTDVATAETICSVDVLKGGCASAALNGGWVGYTVPQVGAAINAPTIYRPFRRTPTGGIQELAGFGASATVEAISPDGQTVIAESATTRMLGNGVDAAAPVSSKLGKVILRDRWYLLLGRSVFEIVPGGGVVVVPTDAGVPNQPDSDAGLLDAGELDSSVPGTDAGAVIVDASASMPSTPDSGTPSGLDARVDGAPDAGTPDAGATKPKSDDGCAAGSTSDAGWTPPLLLILALSFARRRRTQRVRSA